MRRFFICGITVAILCSFAPRGARAEVYVPLEPEMSTLAGNGHMGMADGPAFSATFMQPGGVAVGPDGTIYVTDLAAHTIRAIKNGIVKTIAGGSDPGKVAMLRVGGNVDGPALQARFNRPSGIAVAPDGTLFVADEMNRSIRKIKNGMVSTYAGSVNNVAVDGKGVGGFNFPRGIAIDDDGNLYVADFGKGIRKVTPDGTISTLAYPNDTGVYSISVSGKGDGLIVAYVDRTSIHIIVNGQHRELPFDREREPYEQMLHVGRAFAITVLSADAVAVTDELSNAVRFVRFYDGGVSAPMTRAFAGGIREGTVETGGYRDGFSDRALVDTPYGIARNRDGTKLFVTDSGNRRIRVVSNVNPRTASGGVTPLPPVSATKYRIAFVGASYNFLNTLWPESFAGPVEAGLTKHAVALGLTKPVHVDMMRLDGSGFEAIGSLIGNYYGDGEADLIVWPVSYGEFSKEQQAHPDQKPDDVWKTIQQHLAALQTALAKQHTKLLMVVIPQGEQVSPLEREPRIEETGRDAYDAPRLFQTAQELEDQVAASGVPTLKLARLMQRLEESSDRFPLYNTWDYHLSTRGATWVGSRVLEELEYLRPWR